MEPFHCRREDGILEILLNRPDKKNALNLAMYRGIAAAIRTAEVDDGLRVILFRGAGDAFSAGNDLRDFLDNPPQLDESPVYLFLQAVSQSSKILIAAVQGAAVGIGTTMLLHCDLVLAAPSARLSLPFVALGLVPEFASSLLLPERIGHLRSMELFLLGTAIDAARAEALGLVNRMVPEAELAEAAWGLARQVATLPATAVFQTKRLLKNGSRDVPTRMSEELFAFRTQLESADFRQAVAKFFHSAASGSSQ